MGTVFAGKLVQILELLINYQNRNLGMNILLNPKSELYNKSISNNTNLHKVYISYFVIHLIKIRQF